MSEEFDETQEAADGGNPEQAENSESQAGEEQPKPAAPPSYNLADDPNFRAWQRKQQQKENEWARKEKAMQSRLSVLENAASGDPDIAERAVMAAQLTEAQEIIAAAQQERETQQRWEQFYFQCQTASNRTGVDFFDARIQSALQTWDFAQFAATLAEVKADMAAKTVLPKQPSTPSGVVPPSGGGPRRLNDAEREKKYGELYDLMLNPTENKAKIAALKKELEQ